MTPEMIQWEEKYFNNLYSKGATFIKEETRINEVQAEGKNSKQSWVAQVNASSRKSMAEYEQRVVITGKELQVALNVS